MEEEKTLSAEEKRKQKNEKNRAYYKIHCDAINQMRRAYYKKNRERIRMRAWQASVRRKHKKLQQAEFEV